MARALRSSTSAANDARDAEEARFGRRVGSACEDVGQRQGRARFVVPLDTLAGVHVGGRRHPARVDRLHLLRVREDLRELPGEQLFLVLGQLEVRERGDALDVRDGQHRHDGAMVPRWYDRVVRDVRPWAVAGSWYPGTHAGLAQAVDAHLASAAAGRAPGCPRAIIAPHAGLMYSGPVAAHAYALVQPCQYSAVVLVGPSHFVGFKGVSLWPRGTWETPLGNVAVATELATAIAAESPEILDHPAAHRREHSLEMHLPFVVRLLPGVPIVPLVMGYQTRETAFALGDALARALGAHAGDVLLVASSDLSHYEDAATASRLDAVVVRYVESFDAVGLMDALDREPRHACGGGPIVSVLRAAAQRGATRARVLRYADSGDVSGDKSSVVGYMAAAMW